VQPFTSLKAGRHPERQRRERFTTQGDCRLLTTPYEVTLGALHGSPFFIFKASRSTTKPTRPCRSGDNLSLARQPPRSGGPPAPQCLGRSVLGGPFLERPAQLGLPSPKMSVVGFARSIPEQLSCREVAVRQRLVIRWRAVFHFDPSMRRILAMLPDNSR
jgi:hypothetical protein